MGLQEPCVAMAHLQILIGSYYGVGWKQFKSVLFVQSGNLHDQIVEFKTFFCSEAFPWCLGSASKTRKGGVMALPPHWSPFGDFGPHGDQN